VNFKHVHFKRSRLNTRAEAVTRAAGDDIKLDETGKLLVALKKNVQIDLYLDAHLFFSIHDNFK
jgi:hypothetical protein